MTRRERLLARQLPTVVVEMQGDQGPEAVTFRALPAGAGKDLIEAHPPPDGSTEPFAEATFLPALLSACEVPPAGEERLSAEIWADLRELMTTGEWIHLTDQVLELNDRTPRADLGKG